MAFNVSEFSAQINKHGLAQNNLFILRITLPARLGFIGSEIGTDTLTFLCRSVDLPPFTVETLDYRPRGFGPADKRPIALNYDPLQTVFMVDSNYAVLKFFHRWMQEIVNYDIQAGYTSSSPSSLLPYEFGYKDDYAGTVDVIIYSGHNEDRFYTYKFGSAFPTTIGNIQEAWENSAEVTTLPITFSYAELTVDGTTRGAVTDLANRGNGLIDNLASRGVLGQAIRGISLPTQIQDIVNQTTTIAQSVGSLGSSLSQRLGSFF
jgi:hypothetical protein